MRKLFIALTLIILTAIPAQAHQPVKVLFIGDSLSWGLSAESYDGGYAYQMADRLGAEMGIMGGKSLYHAKGAWPTWQWRDVDLVVVQYVLHDVSSEAGLIPDEDWPGEYGAFLDLLHNDTGGAQIITTTAFWANVTEANNPERYQRTLLYNDFIRQESAAREFVTACDWWKMTADHPEYLSSPADTIPWKTAGFHGDDFHPNLLGHRVLADALVNCYRYGTEAPPLTLLPQVAR